MSKTEEEQKSPWADWIQRATNKKPLEKDEGQTI